MALEDFGDLVDRSQAHIIPGSPIEPNHHVLDHGELTLPTPNGSDGEPSGTLLRQRNLSLIAIKDHTLISSSKDLIRAIDSTTGSTVTTRNVWSLPSFPLIET
jgi:hypothetical protein